MLVSCQEFMTNDWLQKFNGGVLMPSYTLEISNQKAIDQDSTLLLSANNEKDAALFLESLQENNINFLGTGYSMWNLGISIPQIRREYIHFDKQLANRLKNRIGKGNYSDSSHAKYRW